MKDLIKKKNDEYLVTLLKLLCIIVWLCVFLLGFELIEKFYFDRKEQAIEQQEYETTFDNNIVAENVIYVEENENNYKDNWDEKITREVEKASLKYDVPEFVIYAIIATESNFHRTEDIDLFNISSVNYRARSVYDCRGLMQVSQYALDDFNRIHNTYYNMNDLYKVDINIDVGVWYFTQFRTVAFSWTEMYVIYNVGYAKYNKVNYNWFKHIDNNWYNKQRNSFFFMNGVMPPIDSSKSLHGRNKLPVYRPKDRFDKCLNLCFDIFKY